jgi:iron complex transport system substrate-binding protein
MAYAKRPNQPEATITRRGFLSAAAAVAGGVTVFSLPGRAFAAEASVAEGPDPAETKLADSLGRLIDVAVPAGTVVPLGIYAQTLMETLYPGALASLAKEVSGDANDFAEAGLADVVDLVETGTPKASFGKDADLALIASLEPDMILRAGVPRAGVDEELERVQSETGAPCVFLDVSFGKLQESYRTLGRLLGCEERAEELACYIEDAQARAVAAMSGNGSKPKVFYGPRVAGKKVTEGVAVQVDAMSRLGLEPVTRPYDYEGHTVDFAALVEENPDFVLLDDTSFPDAFFSHEGEVYGLWKEVRAINEGRFAVAPALMHSILGSAVFAQSIGMLWIARVVAPSCFKYDMASEMVAFYRLFYGLERDRTSMARRLGLEARNE